MRLTEQPQEITFIKLNGEWYADIPGWYGTIDSLRVIGTTKSYLDATTKNGHYVTFRFSSEGAAGDHVALLNYKAKSNATYELDFKFMTWDHAKVNILEFASGMKKAFGDYPEKIFFSQVE